MRTLKREKKEQQSTDLYGCAECLKPPPLRISQKEEGEIRKYRHKVGKEKERNRKAP
jgi:hypothetical protein